MKPILFNTEMARAILASRKTVTRRLVKFKEGQNPQWSGYVPDGPVLYGSHNIPAVKAPYKPGDVLYVRETWKCNEAGYPPSHCTIEYKAGGVEKFGEVLALPTAKGEWKPSIHMPKEAARIFLRVKQVRVERLNAMQEEDAIAEGFPDLGVDADSPLERFATLWDKTIDKQQRDTYGWWANPWVWVIEFEQISKEDT